MQPWLNLEDSLLESHHPYHACAACAFAEGKEPGPLVERTDPSPVCGGFMAGHTENCAEGRREVKRPHDPETGDASHASPDGVA